MVRAFHFCFNSAASRSDFFFSFPVFTGMIAVVSVFIVSGLPSFDVRRR